MGLKSNVEVGKSGSLPVLAGRTTKTRVMLDRLRMRIRTWFSRFQFPSGDLARSHLESDLKQPGSALYLAFIPEERNLICNAMRMRHRRVADVMVRRADVVSVAGSASLGMALATFVNGGHSRLPVYGDTLDDPLGLLHIKDIVQLVMKEVNPGSDKLPVSAAARFKNVWEMPLVQKDLVREILFVPPSMSALDLLLKMQSARMHMALVIDEYGGTDGLVTIEDLLEVVVGEIEDEHDTVEGPLVRAVGRDQYIADARAPFETLRAVIDPLFGASHPEAEIDVDTVGGLLTVVAGHVPVRGELVTIDSRYEVEVLDADPRRVKRLAIVKRDPPDCADSDDSPDPLHGSSIHAA